MTGSQQPRFAAFRAHDPFCPVDWRWGRANQLLLQGSSYSRSRDDQPTGVALDYLRQCGRCQTPRQRRNLAGRFPDIDQAEQLSRAPMLVRAIVEARILSQQASVEIASACQLPVATVDAFERLFFSVRGRLQARTWVHLAALRPMSCDVTPTEQVTGFVREMGYRGGPVVLEATLRSLGELLREDSASGQSHSEDSLTRRIRRLFLARTAPMSAPLALRMVEFSLNMSDAPLEDFEHVFAPDVQETVDSALNSIESCARETEFAGIVAPILEAGRAA